MEASYPRVANYNVSVSEIEGKVVFLRKLARGGSEHSFGIHVAKLAGMPSTILKRADQVLKQLEDNARGGDGKGVRPTVQPQVTDGIQMSFFPARRPCARTGARRNNRCGYKQPHATAGTHKIKRYPQDTHRQAPMSTTAISLRAASAIELDKLEHIYLEAFLPKNAAHGNR